MQWLNINSVSFPTFLQKIFRNQYIFQTYRVTLPFKRSKMELSLEGSTICNRISHSTEYLSEEKICQHLDGLCKNCLVSIKKNIK